jgi:DNA replication and repair protein RecF
LIEALRVLSTGKSWRSTKTDELISWGEELCRLKAKVVKEDGEQADVEQMLTVGVVQGSPSARRSYKLNGVGKRRGDVAGELATVLFTPEDMSVFQTGPSSRRELLDNVLIQTDRQYRQSLSKYESALRRRNKLILQLRDGEVDRRDFFYWDQLLIETGGYIHEQRLAFLRWLEARPGIRESYKLFYDHSVINEERLRKYANAEVGAGHTLVGPHKDDWQIWVKRGPAPDRADNSDSVSSDKQTWRDIVTYGSRGEQRLSLLWFKLQEVSYIREKLGENPVMLLDDVFSELDEENCRYLLDATEGVQTIIMTVPGQEVLPDKALPLFTN